MKLLINEIIFKLNEELIFFFYCFFKEQQFVKRFQNYNNLMIYFQMYWLELYSLFQQYL